jgi:hypothetical protein
VGIERRRGQRFAVSGVTGLVHVTSGARVLTASPGALAVETSRQLRVGKPYGFATAAPGADRPRYSGTVTSCRLVAVRPGASGSSVSVYEAAVQPEPGAAAFAPGEQLTVDAAYPATARILSTTGTLVETEVELLVGSSCRIELMLAGRTFSSRACVAFLHHLGEGGGSGLFHLGVEFHHTPPEGVEVLESFLVTLAG